MTRSRGNGVGLDGFQTAFVKLARANATSRRIHEVFRDFCELSALAISNSVDRSQFDTREQRYLQIAGTYQGEEMARFAAMLAQVVESMELGFHDCLGKLFMHLELGDHWKGQFFTPYEVATLMARMTVGDVSAQLEQKPFITVAEPASGAGGMVVALAEAIHDQGINFQRVMHVTATDIDSTAAHMTYIQMSLRHIPGIVVHGDALWPDRKTWGHWVTPAHVLGGWDRKLAADGAVVPGPIPMLSDTIEPADLEGCRAAVVVQRIEAEQLALF